MKTQQIHIVGEFANMMLRSYADSLTYIKDYFSLEYDVFLRKYFKGRQRTGEIMRNITPGKYNKLFGDLSDIQKQIIDDDQSQYISVIAGPGSGKTRVLVHKLAALLSLEDIKAEQLLMLTFSRLAAREFKSRLEKLIDINVNYVDIKTFHSYCFDLLGKIGNEEEFDDVVKTAAQMIESGEVEEDKIAKAVLVIDEAQDIDEDEYNLIKALIMRNPDIKIIAVGDDDQNIFEFRGSDSKYLQSIINDFNATKYEMVDNYRSKQRIVDFSNLFAKTIRTRIKTQNIRSTSKERGYVSITEHVSEDLEYPVCNDLLSRKLSGTTAILTITNESALKIVGMLVKKGIDAKLIQSDDNINLYNLVEFRYFLKEISKCNSPVVDDDSWNKAKYNLKTYFKNSNIFDKVITVIEAFENENVHKYKNDFITFISESSFSDFEKFASNQIIVSTIHKSKGREYDNVFMLLDSNVHNTDEQKRKMYVGMTRAKSNLFIHTRKPSFKKIATRLGIDYKYDETEYEEPTNMEIQLGYHDVSLGFFKKQKNKILSLRCGYLLSNKDDYLVYDNKKILRYSKAFCENTLTPILLNGYQIVKSEVRYIAAWRDKDHPDEEESAIILPNIYLKKVEERIDEENASEISPHINEQVTPQKEKVTVVQEMLDDSFAYDNNKKYKPVINLTEEEIKEIKKTALFKALRGYRTRIAKEQNVPAFYILHDKTLFSIVLIKPETKDELIMCHAFTIAKYEKYGEQILEIVKKYSNN